MPMLRRAVPRGHPGAARAHPLRPATRVYPAAGESVPQARQFVTAALTGWGLGAVADDAALVTSELAANAARHGAGTAHPQILVRVTRVRLGAVIEVGDHDPAGPPWPPPEPGPDDENGRGLRVVLAVAHRAGWRRDRDWKIMWAEVRVPRPARPRPWHRPAAPAASVPR